MRTICEHYMRSLDLAFGGMSAEEKMNRCRLMVDEAMLEALQSYEKNEARHSLPDLVSSPGSERGSDELSLMIELENLSSKLARLELRVMEQDFQRHEAVRIHMIGANMTSAVQVTDTDFAVRLKSTLRRPGRHFEQSKEQKRLSRRLRWSRGKRLRRRRLRKNAQKKEEEEEAELESSSRPESMPELVSTSSESIPQPVWSSSDAEESSANRSKSAPKKNMYKGASRRR